MARCVAEAGVVKESLMGIHSHAPPITRRQMKQGSIGSEDTMDMAEVRDQNTRIMREDSLMDSIKLSQDSRLGVLVHQAGN